MESSISKKRDFYYSRSAAYRAKRWEEDRIFGPMEVFIDGEWKEFTEQIDSGHPPIQNNDDTKFLGTLINPKIRKKKMG